jgi:integrase
MRNTVAGKSRHSWPDARDTARALQRQDHLGEVIMTVIFTGMCGSELRGLCWRHVDFATKIIRVEQRADVWRQVGVPKTAAGHRDIPMSPMVVNTLREWRLQARKGRWISYFQTRLATSKCIRH